MEDESEKFKVLYDITFHEYKTEIERSKAIEDKVAKLFTVLNIIITLILALLTRPIFWDYFSIANLVLKLMCIFALIFLFSFLITAWFRLFAHLKSRKVSKLELEPDNTFEDITYDDSKNVNYLYFTAYKTYQEAIWENAKASNSSYESLEKAWNSIKYGFSIFCIFLFFLFLIFLHGVLL